MANEKMLNRRAFLKGAAMTAVGMLAASCAQPTPVVVEKEVPVEKIVKETVVVEKAVPVEKVVKETVVVEKEVAVEKVVTATPVPTKFKEAPMLADLVKAGKLPPVEERIPLKPRVIPVYEKIGKYGGIIRRGHKGPADGPGPNKLVQQGYVWFNLDLSLAPHIAESWEINKDASVWTWKLRQGMKWSDGHPYTSGDVRWWYDHVLKNKTLTTGTPAAWSTGSPRVLMELETPDDFTVVLKFAHPNPLFAHLYVVRGDPHVPGHYLKQFHIDTTEDKAALEAKMKEGGFDTWDKLYGNMNNWQMNPDRPVHYPWVSKSKMSDELFIMERNPYYFAVDAEGQQLPYLDKIVHRLFSTPDVFNMWIVNGEVDFSGRHVDVGNYTLYKENEQKGDYRIYHGINGNTTSINWNLTSKNPNIREFLQNRDVRFALNYAVNRAEINDLVYDGLAEPRQCGPMDQSPQFYPKLAFAYLEYDPDKANALLDKAGYTKRDSEGFRLWKDGSGRCGFNIDYINQADTDEVALYVKYFADVGVFCTYKYIERSLYTQRYNANEVDASVAFGVGRSLIPMIAPDILLGTAVDHPWACAWGLWRNSSGKDPNGEEPPQGHWIWTMWNLYDQIKVEPNEAKREELFRGILDVWYEELPMAGFLSQFKRPIIVKNGLRNYVDNLPIDTTTNDTNLANVQTLFWEEPEKHM